MGTEAEAKKNDVIKLFVLDTNVLVHDHNSLFNFENNDIKIPFTVMEELDKLKNGDGAVNHEARASARLIRNMLDKFLLGGGDIKDGIPLNSGTDITKKLGKLYIDDDDAEALTRERSGLINDNLIIKSAQEATEDQRFKGRPVVMVSKDNIFVVKCAMVGTPSEDYKKDRVENDHDTLFASIHSITRKQWLAFGDKVKVEKGTIYTIPIGKLNVKMNEYITVDAEKSELHGIVIAVYEKTFTFKILNNYKKGKGVFGVLARNDKQNFALNILMDPEIEIVAISGNAGSGKTLLSLATGFNNMYDPESSQSKIIATRALIPLGDDMGFLPGDEKDKMLPWMGAFSDNMEFLASGKAQSLTPTKEVKVVHTMKDLEEKLELKSINFMRGRTFHNKFVIIDEAQNLTLSQIKAIVSRVGDDTKIVLVGNTDQIDTPYLTPESSGLTLLVHRFRGQDNFASIHLDGVIRSTVAEQADRLL